MCEKVETSAKVEKPLALKKVDYSSITQTLRVSFNQAIIVQENLKSSLKIELKDPKTPILRYEIKHKEISLDDSKSRIIIEFDFKK